MSYIRPLEERRYSNGEKGLYAFLSGPHTENEKLPDYFIESYGDIKETENYVEITCRILEKAGVEISEEDVNKLRKELELEPKDL